MWIKICGMTTPEALEAAVGAGADAVGFVFAESVRRVSVHRAAVLAEAVRGRVRCVAVTRHPGQDEIDEILAIFRPDVLQSDAADLHQLRLPQSLERLPVLRSAGEALPPRLLFEGAVSGAGRACDWGAAAEAARRSELVLAGGLDPTNVTTAIAAVRPFGVDVSSGVEARPGVKDPQAIERFVKAARMGCAAVQEPT
ncbi:MAG: phosphoribosylanthranilate isomerase [Steroidobacteraceae bacterium]